jgi:hypothetical protein
MSSRPAAGGRVIPVAATVRCRLLPRPQARFGGILGVVRFRLSSLCLISVVAACGAPAPDVTDDAPSGSGPDARPPIDAPPDAAMVTLCRDVIGADEFGPMQNRRIWRWRGSERTVLHDTAGHVRVLSPARDRLAIALGTNLRILDIATAATRDITFPVDETLVSLDWTGGDDVLVHVRAASGDRLDLVDAASGDISPLVAADPRPITWPRLSPDGERVGFVRDGALLWLPATGGALQALVAPLPNEPFNGFFGWSAESDFIAYRTAARFVAEPNVMSPQPYVPRTGYWSPTGDRLVVDTTIVEGAHADFRSSLQVFDFGAQTWKELARSGMSQPYVPRHPHWSLDSREIAHNSTVSPVVFLSTVATGGLPETIVTDWTLPVLLLGPCP